MIWVLTFLGTAYGSDLVGIVKYKGKPPEPTPLRMQADPVCLKQNEGKKVFTEDLVVGANGGIQNVFVYIKEGAPTGQPSGEGLSPVVLDQQGCRYVPRVLGVQVGQPLTILNSDPTLHNVHALAKKNSGFNVGMATKSKKGIEKKFSKPEVMIRLKCDVHGWMSSYIGVVDHPFFAVTNEKGEFQIENLPRGEYTLELWHEKLGTQTAKVTVADLQGKKRIEVSFP